MYVQCLTPRALALEHGVTVTMPPTDEPWGVREFICDIQMATPSGSGPAPAGNDDSCLLSAVR